eukprot:gene13857-18584_t
MTSSLPRNELLLALINERATTPSYFELYLLDKIESVVLPSMRHVYTTIVNQYDLPFIAEHFDNLYMLLRLVITWRVLSLKDATFFEDMCGMKRVGISQDGFVSKLTSYQKIFSAIYISCLPRLLMLLKEYAMKIRERSRQRILQQNHINSLVPSSLSLNNYHYNRRISNNNSKNIFQVIKSKCKDIWCQFEDFFAERLLPSLLIIGESSITANHLLYICNKSRYYHPVFACLGIVIIKSKYYNQMNGKSKYLLNDDYFIDDWIDKLFNRNNISQDNGETQNPTISLVNNDIMESLTNNNNNLNENKSSISSPAGISTIIIMSLLLSVRIADWFYRQDLSSDNIANRLAEPIKLPPPPNPLPVQRGGIIPPVNTTLCPICRKKRINSCVIRSGYVFCYLCILPILRDDHACPITGLQCNEDDIIRLYENGDSDDNNNDSNPIYEKNLII